MKKSTWIYLGIIIFLIFVVWFNNREESSTESMEIETSFSQLDTLKIDRLELQSTDGESIVLVKDAGVWMLAEPIRYKASESAINNAVKKLGEITIENLISKNPQTHAKFEVDSVTGFTVKVFENGNLSSDMILGKTDQNWSHTYARENGNDQVYLLNGNMTYVFKKKLKDWRDKAIVKLDKSLIKKVTIDSKNNEPIVFDNQDTSWTVQSKGQSFPAKSTFSNQMMSSLSNLLAADFVDDSVEVDFTNPDIQVTTELIGGSINELSFVAVDTSASQYYVKADDQEQKFKLYKGAISSFTKTFEEYKEEKKEEPTENSKTTE